MDAIDGQILQIVQNDGSLSVRDISAQVGLSLSAAASAAHRSRCIALLDPNKLGLGVTVFVSVEVADHNRKTLAGFTAKIAAMREVMEFYRLAGDADKNWFLRP